MHPDQAEVMVAGMLRTLLAVVTTLVGALALSTSMSACKEPGPPAPSGDDQGKTVVARIAGETITLADFERRLQELPAYVQARYTSPERRKELLDNLVRFEVLAREAKKRGYERDPDVLRYAKQRVIEKMIAEEIDGKLKPADLGQAELRRFYQDHPDLFTQPEAVRVSQIVVADRAQAMKLTTLARALAPRDEAGFRRLVTAHSVDVDSRQRGGDLTFIERGSAQQPRQIVEAAFALREVGEVSEPVETDRGFHVLRLTQRRQGFLRPFDEVQGEVRQRRYQQRRAERIDQWVAEMRKSVNVEVFEDKLQSLAPPADGPGDEISTP